MIAIKHTSLHKITADHVSSVISFYNPKKLIEIDVWIKKIWGTPYSFSTVLSAKPSELTSLINIFSSSGEPIPPFINKIKRLYIRFSTEAKTPLKKASGEVYSAYTTSQLDHFHSKDKYPFLALSFFNLIPSCPTCNHLKSNYQGGYYNPYDFSKKIDDLLKFHIHIKGVKYLDNEKDLEIKLITDKTILDNVTVFKLKEIYSKHIDWAQEIIKKKQIYNESYIDSLLVGYGGKIIKDKSDLINLILSNYISEEELSKRPFSKFTKDIWQQVQHINLT